MPRSIFLPIFKTALPFFLLTTAALLQYGFDVHKQNRPLAPLSIIPARAIKLGNLGLHSATSALMWIYAIQQFGTNPEKLPELIKTINDLDPKFSYPYAFAALVLPPLGFPEQAIEIAKRGIDEADSDWRIPYYLATTYHIYLKDRKNAAFYFDLAAKTTTAPDNIKIIASKYGISGIMREQTKEIWQSIYETANDELVREGAKKHLVQIETLELIERAVIIYKQNFGTYPRNINELTTKKILKAIPPSPFGLEFYLGSNGSVLAK